MISVRKIEGKSPVWSITLKQGTVHQRDNPRIKCQRAKISSIVKGMLKNGVVEKSNSPRASCIVLVKRYDDPL